LIIFLSVISEIGCKKEIAAACWKGGSRGPRRSRDENKMHKKRRGTRVTTRLKDAAAGLPLASLVSEIIMYEVGWTNTLNPEMVSTYQCVASVYVGYWPGVYGDDKAL
jgi:hypothetical protein